MVTALTDRLLGPFKQESSVLPKHDPFLRKVWESPNVSLDQLQLCLPTCGHSERSFFFLLSMVCKHAFIALFWTEGTLNFYKMKLEDLF